MKKLTLVLIMGVLLFSCKKERTFHITAKNAVTGEPYPGLYYEIVREWSGSFENKYKTVGSGELDENGEVYFTKRLHKNSSYSITVAEPTNSCYNRSIYLYPSGEINFEAPFEFAECAYLKRNITNINCNDANDYMILETNNEVNSLGNTDWEFFGCDGYIGDHFSEVPYGSYYFKWQVTRNNISTTYYDTIYLNKGEYRTYEIDY